MCAIFFTHAPTDKIPRLRQVNIMNKQVACETWAELLGYGPTDIDIDTNKDVGVVSYL